MNRVVVDCMKTKILLLLLLFSAVVCGDFYKDINVQVLDEIGRPIPGADVSISYQLNSVQGYIETSPQATNASGQVTIRIINTEKYEDRVEYGFTVIAKYGTQKAEASYDVNSMPNMITLQLKVYRFTVKVVDQAGNPLSAIVSVGKYTAPTNTQGYAKLLVPYGNADIIAAYKGTEGKINMDVVADAEREIIIPLYSLTVHVFDDNGNPLNATVEYSGESAETNQDGSAYFAETPVSIGTLKVTYDNHLKEKSITLSAASDETVVFDSTPPSITDVTVEAIDGVGRITATIADSGTYGSGIDETTRLFVRYKINVTEKEKDMYLVGRDRYRVDIPKQEENTLVLFTIFASDKDGNRNSLSGNYIVPRKETSSGNGEVTPVTPTESGVTKIFGIDLNAIIIVVLIIAIGCAVFIFMKRKAEEY